MLTYILVLVSFHLWTSRLKSLRYCKNNDATKDWCDFYQQPPITLLAATERHPFNFVQLLSTHLAHVTFLQSSHQHNIHKYTNHHHHHQFVYVTGVIFCLHASSLNKVRALRRVSSSSVVSDALMSVQLVARSTPSVISLKKMDDRKRHADADDSAAPPAKRHASAANGDDGPDVKFGPLQSPWQVDLEVRYLRH